MTDNRSVAERFKEILKGLPEDKRVALYSKLKSLPEDQRQGFMETVVNKADGEKNTAKTAPSKKQTESVKPKPKTPAKDKAPAPRKKLKQKYKNMLIYVAIALVFAGVVGIEVYRNWDKIKGTTAPAPSETVVTSVEDTTLPEASETTEAEPTPIPTPTPTPAPTPVPVAEDAPDLTGLVVVIDPGHQMTTSEEQELCATWLSVEKPRCTSGATGVVTGVTEYDLTLQYALVMKSYLEQCGATVILTRDTSDVDLSNQERAQIAVDNEADVFIRIHADEANDSEASGIRVYVPDSGSYTSSSTNWGNTYGTLLSEASGLPFEQTRQTYLYTGLNYANSIPSFQVSLGFLSNSDDEAILVTEDNMTAVAQATSEFCLEFMN
jgi:N-acetylmuramoyl-L-alanine amidase